MNVQVTAIQQEQKLLDIFRKILDNHELSAEDNLLDAGLNSITSVAAAMMAKRQGFSFKPSQIAECGTVATLSNFEGGKTPVESFLPTHAGNNRPYRFTPTQRSWNQDGFSNHYNIYGAWEYDRSSLSIPHFKSSVETLSRSEAELRLEIYHENGELVQRVRDYSSEMTLETIDLSALPQRDRTTRAADICNGLQTAFELEAGQRFCRFINFKLGDDGSGWIFIIVHHFTVDGFGWGNMLRKLSQNYEGEKGDISAVAVPENENVAQKWSESLFHHGRNSRRQDVEFWTKIPAHEISKDLKKGTPDWGPGAIKADFNRQDAKRLHELESGVAFDCQTVERIFSSQATVVDYLDAKETQQLLGRNWASRGFNDFDLFAVSAADAVKTYFEDKYIWMDMLAATRDSIFPNLDTSSCVGYISELTPFWILRDGAVDLAQAAVKAARDRLDRPLSGVGLRAAKYFAQDPQVREIVDRLRLPQLGINYHASLLYSFGATLLDLNPVQEYLGPTLDERGIAYKFWFRVSYTGSRMSILLRYDPSSYGLKEAREVVRKTKQNLENILMSLDETGA